MAQVWNFQIRWRFQQKHFIQCAISIIFCLKYWQWTSSFKYFSRRQLRSQFTNKSCCYLVFSFNKILDFSHYSAAKHPVLFSNCRNSKISMNHAKNISYWGTKCRYTMITHARGNKCFWMSKYFSKNFISNVNDSFVIVMIWGRKL